MSEESQLAFMEMVKPVEGRRLKLRESPTANGAEAAPYLRTYWRIVQKRRWIILSVIVIVFTVALIATLKETPIYRARALVEIEKENPNILTVQELFQLETISDNYLESQYKILQSESVARRVIERLHLDQVKEFNPSGARPEHSRKAGGEASEKVNIRTSDSEQEILHRFASRLEVQPLRQSRLVQVSFESEQRELAAEIVNALTSGYIEQNLETRWNATQQATEWISQQLVGLKIKLEKSEEDLQRYAQANGLLFLESGQGKTENIMDQRLRQLQEELTRAQAERYEKESHYQLLQSGDYGSLPGAVDNKLLQDLTGRLTELQTSYAQLATTFSADYPKVKQVQSQIDQTQTILDRERERVAERITNEYQAAERREALVHNAFAEEEQRSNQAAARAVQYNILKREVDTNKQLYEGLLQRMKEAGVSAGLKATNIRIIDPAMPPVSPAKPRVALNLALALLLGLAGGIAMAFVQEHLDNTFKTPEDVERFLQLPALGTIPALESLNGHRRGVYSLGHRRAPRNGDKRRVVRAGSCVRIDELATQSSALPEAFRSLRTSVLLSTANRPPRSLLITSAQPAEGKTTVATNLAISLAQLGQRVLLIDADLRRPSVHKVFQIASSPGLVNYLAGLQEWPQVAVATTVDGLAAIPSGPVPPNPVELLSSELMRTLLREAAKSYTMVLIDSPPMLNVADSRVLAAQAEGVVLVAKGNATPRELSRRARAYAEDVGANVIGVVLNNVDVRGGDYDYYHYYKNYYGYGYGREESEGEENRT
jgi:polysaccharide biosynthesis transport protein